LLTGPLSAYRLSFAQRLSRFGCALASVPIGVDIETADRGEIPWNVLHDAEAARLGALGVEEREKLFLRIWAAKEAYAKALGLGFWRETAEFAVRCGHGPTGEIDDPAAPPGQTAHLAFADLEGTTGAAAVAWVEG